MLLCDLGRGESELNFLRIHTKRTQTASNKAGTKLLVLHPALTHEQTHISTGLSVLRTIEARGMLYTLVQRRRSAFTGDRTQGLATHLSERHHVVDLLYNSLQGQDSSVGSEVRIPKWNQHVASS
jgi:hypothetical protein